MDGLKSSGVRGGVSVFDELEKRNPGTVSWFDFVDSPVVERERELRLGVGLRSCGSSDGKSKLLLLMPALVDGRDLFRGSFSRLKDRKEEDFRGDFEDAWGVAIVVVVVVQSKGQMAK